MKILFLTIAMFLHPVHVSLTGIDYNSENRIYTVMVKVYSDDLESDIKASPGCKSGPFKSEDEQYSNYLCDRVVIKEDGKRLTLKLLGSESEGLERRFNLVAKGGRSVKSVTVVNRIMTRLYEDQANMVLFRFDDMEEGYKYTATDTLRNYNVK
ncbi:MAG TPA: DUF6702 family protein [Bacteroidales bacterium]|nr:DUF6702 family protein [Bacteroidales bacterium]